MGSIYTLIPRPVGLFAGLDINTRYAFGLIYDRWQLSNRKANRERFTDQHGVYCSFSRDSLASEMGVSLPTLRACVSTLVRRDIIRSRIPDPGSAWRYYMPEDTVEYFADNELWWLGSETTPRP